MGAIKSPRQRYVYRRLLKGFTHRTQRERTGNFLQPLLFVGKHEKWMEELKQHPLLLFLAEFVFNNMRTCVLSVSPLWLLIELGWDWAQQRWCRRQNNRLSDFIGKRGAGFHSTLCGLFVRYHPASQIYTRCLPARFVSSVLRDHWWLLQTHTSLCMTNIIVSVYHECVIPPGICKTGFHMCFFFFFC